MPASSTLGEYSDIPFTPPFKIKGNFLKNLNSKRYMYTPMFIAALFTIAKVWKQPKYPSIDKWINRMCYISAFCNSTDGLRVCYAK